MNDANDDDDDCEDYQSAADVEIVCHTHLRRLMIYWAILTAGAVLSRVSTSKCCELHFCAFSSNPPECQDWGAGVKSILAMPGF